MADADAERSIQDVVLDYALYAPVGFLVTVVEELPKLSDKGRDRITARIRSARVIGKLAVGEAQRRIAKGTAQLAGQPPRSEATGPLDGLAASPEDLPPAAAVAPCEGRNGSQRAVVSSGPSRPQPARKAASRRHNDGPAAASVPKSGMDATELSQSPAAPTQELAIPGYDTLAASQVVQRLSSLRQDELDAIRAYELSTRGRRTILHRISQLTGGATPASPAAG